LGQREAEPAIGAEPRAAGGRELVAAAGGIALAVEQPIVLAAPRRAPEDRLAGRLRSQDVDVPNGAARPKRSPVHRFHHRELDIPEQIARFPSNESTAVGRLAVGGEVGVA
jgi:hypothetical protein